MGGAAAADASIPRALGKVKPLGLFPPPGSSDALLTKTHATKHLIVAVSVGAQSEVCTDSLQRLRGPRCPPSNEIIDYCLAKRFHSFFSLLFTCLGLVQQRQLVNDFSLFPEMLATSRSTKKKIQTCYMSYTLNIFITYFKYSVSISM